MVKATETSIRKTLQKYNILAAHLKVNEYELDVVAKNVGSQQRCKYALTNGRGTHTTAFVGGQTMLYYLEGILKGIEIMRNNPLCNSNR